MKCSEILRLKPADNDNFPRAWPGPILEIEKGFKVNFMQLPDPITMYKSIKEIVVQSELKLTVIELPETDTHARL